MITFQFYNLVVVNGCLKLRNIKSYRIEKILSFQFKILIRSNDSKLGTSIKMNTCRCIFKKNSYFKTLKNRNLYVFFSENILILLMITSGSYLNKEPKPKKAKNLVYLKNFF